MLIHGLASNALLWSEVGDLLAESGFAPIAVDLRGHGHSDKPNGPYDINAVLQDLCEVALKLNLGPTVIVGQSWGGNLALEAVAAHPEIFPIGVGVDGGLIDLQAQWPNWSDCEEDLRPPALAGMNAVELRERIRKHHPDWSDQALSATMGNFEIDSDGTARPWLTLERHLLALRGLWEHRPAEVVVGLRRPFLMLGAESDNSRSVERRARAERHAALSPFLRTRWVVGDHDLHAQQPGVVADAIMEVAAVLED